MKMTRMPALVKIFDAIMSRRLSERSAQTMRSIMVRMRAMLKPKTRSERRNVMWYLRVFSW